MIRFISLVVTFFFSPMVFASFVQGQQFQHWGGNCEIVDKQRVCYLQQILTENKKPLLVTVIGYTAEKKYPTLFLELSASVQLNKTIALRVDRKKAIYFDVQCEKGKCMAGFGMDALMLKQFKKGRRAVLSYTNHQGHKRELPISLMGVTAGLKALQRQ
jgi:invasion protein IalB